MKKHLSIQGTIAAILAVITFVALEHEPDGTRLVDLVSDTTALVLLGIGTVVALPLAFAMPRLKAAFMGELWRAPSSTYLMPRWLIWLCLSSSLGQIIGVVAYALVHEPPLLWLGALLTCICGAFCLGAWPRLSRHAGSEFTMPWWRLP
jgi:hypothetical protein